MFLRLVSATACLCLPLPTLAQHDHAPHEIEEIIISTSQNKSRTETALPVHVLSGEDLRQQASATIGESLQQTVGVTASSFGAGVGQPVIRGLSGNRVRVMQNDLPIVDAAGVSQDHASAVEALLAERIEIVRGPATLLYGSGAIGGVVNVFDNRVPNDAASGISGGMELRHQSVNDGTTAVARLDGGIDKIGWHIDGMYRETNDLEIPDLAVDVAALETLEDHVDHDHSLSRGFIANSNTRADSVTAGASWVGDSGFLGLAISRLRNNYGLPPGIHAHEEHDEEEEIGEAAIRLGLEQSRMDLHGERQLGGLWNRFTTQIAINDYRHRELEGREIGTIFDSEGVEGRFKLHHGVVAGFAGVLGLQAGKRDFSALGEEAFIPPSEIESAGLFVLETLAGEQLSWEFGLRLDNDRIDTRGACDSRERSWSASAATIWPIRADTNLTLGFSRAERAPTVEERYSNVDIGDCTVRTDPATRVVHAATARIELGNPRLNTETSNNWEIGLQKYVGALRFVGNIFFNRFDDFIFLNDVGEFEETIVSSYLQDDARFYGVEGEIHFPWHLTAEHHLDIGLLGDYVRGKLDHAAVDGNRNLPRIPPHRLAVEITYNANPWSVALRSTKVAQQDAVAANELATPGYTRIDAHADYHLQWRRGEFIFFIKGSNLTDREIRDHTSPLKHFAPAGGRSIEVGLRAEF